MICSLPFGMLGWPAVVNVVFMCTAHSTAHQAQCTLENGERNLFDRNNVSTDSFRRHRIFGCVVLFAAPVEKKDNE